MGSSGSLYFQRMEAETAVRHLIRALMGVGYSEPAAVEAAEQVLDEASRYGLDMKPYWAALERVAPIPKDV